MTPTDITVTGEDFVSVNEVAGVPVGTALELQTKCASAVIVQRKEGKPSSTDDNGRVMKSVKNASSIYQVREGSEEVWLRLNTYNFESEGKVGVYPAVEDINYVARLNGTDQYWLLSESIQLTSGDIVRLTVKVSDLVGNLQYILDDDSGNFNRLFLILNDYGSTTFRKSIINTLSIDNIQYADGATPPIYDGEFHYFDINIRNNSNLSVMGARYNFIEFFGGTIKDVEVVKGGEVTNKIPLTNKAQGATQLPTVGNVSATMIGYSEDVWEQI